MSYSFSVKAGTKSEAIEQVAAKLAEVVAAQPVHEADQVQANASASTFIGLLADDDTKDVAVSMNGSIYRDSTGIRQASVSISVGMAEKA